MPTQHNNMSTCHAIGMWMNWRWIFAWISQIKPLGREEPLLQEQTSNCSIDHRDLWYKQTRTIQVNMKRHKHPPTNHTIADIHRGGTSNSNRYYHKMAKSTHHTHEGRSHPLCGERLDCSLSLSLSLFLCKWYFYKNQSLLSRCFYRDNLSLRLRIEGVWLVCLCMCCVLVCLIPAE